MKFVKFPSIENAYRLTIIENNRHVPVEVQQADKWVVTEKIDGSNVSIIVDRNEIGYEVARRNAIIKDENDDMGELVADSTRVKFWFECIERAVRDEMNRTLRDFDQVMVYGEWYGKGILGRVFYGDQKYFRMFAIAGIRGDEVIEFPFAFLQKFAVDHRLTGLMVPVIKYTDTYNEALQTPNDMPSLISPTNDIMEGIVIRPLYVGGSFRVKSKNEKFDEKAKNGKMPAVLAGDVLRLRDLFKQYATESRMFGIFSKLGTPTNNRDTGRYLAAFIEDIKEDFIKDHPEFLDEQFKDDRKQITNLGRLPYEIFITVWDKVLQQ